MCWWAPRCAELRACGLPECCLHDALQKDLREKHGKGVDAEQEKAIAEEVNACALVDTSAKTPDEEEAGVPHPCMP